MTKTKQADLEILRIGGASHCDVVHRYTGDRRSVAVEVFENARLFRQNGFIPEDWVLSSEFTGIEKYQPPEKSKK